MTKSLKNHWNEVYQKSAVEDLGWYESSAEPSLRLIRQCKLPVKATQLHVGAGASTLVDELVADGYEDIIASDLSESALEALKKRLGPEVEEVSYVVDDLTNPKELSKLEAVDLWHDRAVLHFFTKETEQQAYFKLLKQIVKPGAYVIIAVYNLQGASNCSGLPVFRYNTEMLQQALCSDFTLLEAFNHNYIQPSGGSRAFVYCLFKRQG